MNNATNTILKKAFVSAARNTIITQAIAESERMCASVAVPLNSAAVRAALKDLMFNFTEEKGMFMSEEGVKWSGGDFSPDWSLVSECWDADSQI